MQRLSEWKTTHLTSDDAQCMHWHDTTQHSIQLTYNRTQSQSFSTSIAFYEHFRCCCASRSFIRSFGYGCMVRTHTTIDFSNTLCSEKSERARHWWNVIEIHKINDISLFLIHLRLLSRHRWPFELTMALAPETQSAATWIGEASLLSLQSHSTNWIAFSIRYLCTICLLYLNRRCYWHEAQAWVGDRIQIEIHGVVPCAFSFSILRFPGTVPTHTPTHTFLYSFEKIICTTCWFQHNLTRALSQSNGGNWRHGDKNSITSIMSSIIDNAEKKARKNKNETSRRRRAHSHIFWRCFWSGKNKAMSRETFAFAFFFCSYFIRKLHVIPSSVSYHRLVRSKSTFSRIDAHHSTASPHLVARLLIVGPWNSRKFCATRQRCVCVCVRARGREVDVSNVVATEGR